MNTNIIQLPFPQKVIRGSDTLDYAGESCKTIGMRAFILGGKTALEKTKEKLVASLRRAGVEVVGGEWYGGECSEENISRMVDAATICKADVIVAVGGGKALDTGKATGSGCHLPVLTVPTIAATCAAVTPLSVVYDGKGAFAKNLFLPNCPSAVIVDTGIIVNAPAKWLVAGIGDTLAKMYELRAASERIQPTSITISAVSNGQICYDIIKRFGHEALLAAEKCEIGIGFESTVDAIILGAGISSIFGGEYLRNAAAHGIYNGFTKIPAMHVPAHGAIVGYGNLCLLALEGRSDEEITEEIRLAMGCGIPVTLSQLAKLSAEEIRIGAEASARSTAMSCMPFKVTADMVIDAIRRVDALAETR